MLKLKVIALVVTLSWLVPAKLFAQNSFKQTLEFIQQYDSPIVFKSADGESQIVVSSKHQGRVLTSTANGPSGLSNAWLDKAALINRQGSVGGEDRTWIAPIGSKFSLFYAPDTEMTSENWRVPPALNKQHYFIKSLVKNQVHFQKKLDFENHQGTLFSTLLDRTVTLLSDEQISETLEVKLPKGIKKVGFASHNKLTNLGKNWSEDKGLISIWSMAMFQGTDDSISIFPIETENALPQRYLFPLQQDRLVTKGNVILYKTDGRYRSKIGIPANISKNVVASYSRLLNRLTVIKFTMDNTQTYPVSLEQVNTEGALGDVSNAYNHGNMDGSLLDPAGFYELESAAPLKALKTNESIEHTHQTFHFFGKPSQLDPISIALIGIPVSETSNIF